MAEVLDQLIPKAIMQGGTHLDCFDSNHVLPLKYSKFGFIPVAKVKFNEEFAPSEWDYDKLGKPDIIFMMLDTAKNPIDSHSGTSTMSPETRVSMITKEIENTDYSEDYGTALSIVQEKIKR